MTSIEQKAYALFQSLILSESHLVRLKKHNKSPLAVTDPTITSSTEISYSQGNLDIKR